LAQQLIVLSLALIGGGLFLLDAWLKRRRGQTTVKNI
jgi:hypothetical protein